MDENAEPSARARPPLSVPFFYGWFVVALGFVLDIASYSGRAAQQRYQTDAA